MRIITLFSYHDPIQAYYNNWILLLQPYAGGRRRRSGRSHDRRGVHAQRLHLRHGGGVAFAFPTVPRRRSQVCNRPTD